MGRKQGFLEFARGMDQKISRNEKKRKTFRYEESGTTPEMPRIYKTDQKDKERIGEGKLSNIFIEKSWTPVYNLQGKSERTKETISRIGRLPDIKIRKGHISL